MLCGKSFKRHARIKGLPLSELEMSRAWMDACYSIVYTLVEKIDQRAFDGISDVYGKLVSPLYKVQLRDSCGNSAFDVLVSGKV